jgi:hypothetical protein
MPRNRTNVLSLVGPYANRVTQKSIFRSVTVSSRARNLLQDIKPSFLNNAFVDALKEWKTSQNPNVNDVFRVMETALEEGAVIAKKDVLIDMFDAFMEHTQRSMERFLPRFLRIVEALLEGIDIDYRSRSGMTVLLVIVNSCVAYNEYSPATQGFLLQWCKDRGANFSATLLFQLLAKMKHKAVNFDLAALAGLLVDLGVDPNHVVHDGEKWHDMKATTALHLCLWIASPDTAAALLTRGANPNIPMHLKNVEIPMLYACIREDTAPGLVPLLIAGGANPNARDGRGAYLLAMVASPDIKKNRFEAFKTLTDAGGDFRKRDASGDTVLHAILRTSRSRKVQDDDEDDVAKIVKMCIRFQPSFVNARGAGGASLIFLAMQRPLKLRRASETAHVLAKAGATLTKEEREAGWRDIVVRSSRNHNWHQ